MSTIQPLQSHVAASSPHDISNDRLGFLLVSAVSMLFPEMFKRRNFTWDAFAWENMSEAKEVCDNCVP